METSTTVPRARERSPARPARRRWPYSGVGQLRLLLASIAIVVGSFLPWVDTAFGSFTGLAGPGVWTLYAGILGIAGSMIRRRRLAAGHAVVSGVVALVLVGWQSLRLVDLCGGGACGPSTGLFMVAIGGVVVLLQVRPILVFQPDRT